MRGAPQGSDCREGPFEVVQSPVTARSSMASRACAGNARRGARPRRRPATSPGCSVRQAAVRVRVGVSDGRVRVGVHRAVCSCARAVGGTQRHGLGRSVNDIDATRFAATSIASWPGATVPFAVARAARPAAGPPARPRVGRHWHLARVYAGRGGGGACCGRGSQAAHAPDAGFKEFLDKAGGRVAVATAASSSAGGATRRRSAAPSVTPRPGCLIFGMGNLGKSSLAARVANRMPRHRTVVVFERYDALAIFEQCSRPLAAGERAVCERTWREQIATDAPAPSREPWRNCSRRTSTNTRSCWSSTTSSGSSSRQAREQVRTPVRDADGTVDAWRARHRRRAARIRRRPRRSPACL